MAGRGGYLAELLCFFSEALSAYRLEMRRFMSGPSRTIQSTSMQILRNHEI